jgi:hypothetical protein
MKKRDLNILMSMKGEINLNTRCSTPNKKAYKRKFKHKHKMFD